MNCFSLEPPLRMGAGTDVAIFKRILEEEKGGHQKNPITVTHETEDRIPAAFQ